jgi:hypothetical protein
MAIPYKYDDNPQDPESGIFNRKHLTKPQTPPHTRDRKHLFNKKRKGFYSSSSSSSGTYSSLQQLLLYAACGGGSGCSSFSSSSVSPCSIVRRRTRKAVSNLSALFMGTLLLALSAHRVISLIMTHRKWINAPITYISRTCPLVQYETIPQQQPLQLLQPPSPHHRNMADEDPNTNKNNSNLRICITTLTDQKSPSYFQRFIRWRNFDGLLDLTWPNKQAYAEKYGYYLFDGSVHIDPSRPPAWSKIKAAQYLLEQRMTSTTEEDGTKSSSSTSPPPFLCDWVMWADADTVIMNSDVRIQDFLPADPTKDLLVAPDKGGGYNSGVFFLRNTAWSRQFLQDWWNMEDFVRPPGLSLSGDNNAMKALLASMPDFHDHVLAPPRCTFNSFASFLTLGESLQVMDHLQEQPWYMDVGHYHKGDFIAHAAGKDNKLECIRLLMHEAR